MGWCAPTGSPMSPAGPPRTWARASSQSPRQAAAPGSHGPVAKGFGNIGALTSAEPEGTGQETGRRPASLDREVERGGYVQVVAQNAANLGVGTRLR